jgi:hypothetical protein
MANGFYYLKKLLLNNSHFIVLKNVNNKLISEHTIGLLSRIANF